MYLLVVLSLSIASIFGLGWLVATPLLSFKPRSFIEDLPLVLMYGLLAHYGIVLCLESLDSSLLISGLLSLLGLGMFVRFLLGPAGYRQYFQFAAEPLVWIGVAVVLLLYVVKIVSEPLEAWDARSIWFFHARIVYLEGALSSSAGWTAPSLSFAHTDYPKLVAVLAGQASHLAGFWNEYLPKFALVLVLLTPVLIVASFARKSLSYLLLFCVFPFSMGSLMWNGYMDGYMALYFAMAMLLAGRYFDEHRPLDLISSLVCLALTLNIKNEGALALGVGALAIGTTAAIGAKSCRWRWRQLSQIRWAQWLLVVIAIAPSLLWTYHKTAWGLHNDLQMGTVQSLQRMLQRLVDGNSLPQILFSMIKYTWLPAAILATLLVLNQFRKARLPLAAFPAIIAGVALEVGLVGVYLLTPHDLGWHLTWSADRTLLSVSSCFYVGIFWVMRHGEEMNAGTAGLAGELN